MKAGVKDGHGYYFLDLLRLADTATANRIESAMVKLSWAIKDVAKLLCHLLETELKKGDLTIMWEKVFEVLLDRLSEPCRAQQLLQQTFDCSSCTEVGGNSPTMNCVLLYFHRMPGDATDEEMAKTGGTRHCLIGLIEKEHVAKIFQKRREESIEDNDIEVDLTSFKIYEFANKDLYDAEVAVVESSTGSKSPLHFSFKEIQIPFEPPIDKDRLEEYFRQTSTNVHAFKPEDGVWCIYAYTNVCRAVPEVLPADMAVVNISDDERSYFKPNQLIVAQRLLSKAKELLTVDVSWFRDVRTFVFTQRYNTLLQQTHNRIQLSLKGHNVYVGLSSRTHEKAYEDFRQSIFDNPTTLHIMIVDECHYHPKSTGYHNQFLNDTLKNGQALTQPNYLQLLVSATPLNCLTKHSKVRETNVITWYGGDNTPEQVSYCGLHEALGSMLFCLPQSHYVPTDTSKILTLTYKGGPGARGLPGFQINIDLALVGERPAFKAHRFASLRLWREWVCKKVNEHLNCKDVKFKVAMNRQGKADHLYTYLRVWDKAVTRAVGTLTFEGEVMSRLGFTGRKEVPIGHGSAGNEVVSDHPCVFHLENSPPSTRQIRPDTLFNDLLIEFKKLKPKGIGANRKSKKSQSKNPDGDEESEPTVSDGDVMLLDYIGALIYARATYRTIDGKVGQVGGTPDGMYHIPLDERRTDLRQEIENSEQWTKFKEVWEGKCTLTDDEMNECSWKLVEFIRTEVVRKWVYKKYIGYFQQVKTEIENMDPVKQYKEHHKIVAAHLYYWLRCHIVFLKQNLQSFQPNDSYTPSPYLHDLSKKASDLTVLLPESCRECTSDKPCACALEQLLSDVNHDNNPAQVAIEYTLSLKIRDDLLLRESDTVRSAFGFIDQWYSESDKMMGDLLSHTFGAEGKDSGASMKILRVRDTVANERLGSVIVAAMQALGLAGKESGDPSAFLIVTDTGATISTHIPKYFMQCKVEVAPQKKVSLGTIKASDRAITYEDIKMPCLLIVTEKARMGNTFPHSFNCLDLRLRVGRNTSTMHQEIGRLWRYPAMTPLGVITIDSGVVQWPNDTSFDNSGFVYFVQALQPEVDLPMGVYYKCFTECDVQLAFDHFQGHDRLFVSKGQQRFPYALVLWKGAETRATNFPIFEKAASLYNEYLRSPEKEQFNNRTDLRAEDFLVTTTLDDYVKVESSERNASAIAKLCHRLGRKNLAITGDHYDHVAATNTQLSAEEIDWKVYFADKKEKVLPRRMLLRAPPQAGKTGSYECFVSLLLLEVGIFHSIPSVPAEYGNHVLPYFAALRERHDHWDKCKGQWSMRKSKYHAMVYARRKKLLDETWTDDRAEYAKRVARMASTGNEGGECIIRPLMLQQLNTLNTNALNTNGNADDEETAKEKLIDYDHQLSRMGSNDATATESTHNPWASQIKFSKHSETQHACRAITDRHSRIYEKYFWVKGVHRDAPAEVTRLMDSFPSEVECWGDEATISRYFTREDGRIELLLENPPIVFTPTHRGKNGGAQGLHLGRDIDATTRLQVLVVQQRENSAYGKFWQYLPSGWMVLVMPAKLDLKGLPAQHPLLQAGAHTPNASTGGVGYARLFIQLFAYAIGAHRVWMIDDNVTVIRKNTLDEKDGRWSWGTKSNSVRLSSYMEVAERVFREGDAVDKSEVGPECTQKYISDGDVQFGVPETVRELCGASEEYGLIGMMRSGWEMTPKHLFSIRPTAYKVVLLNVQVTVERMLLYPPKGIWEDVDFNMLLLDNNLHVCKFMQYSSWWRSLQSAPGYTEQQPPPPEQLVSIDIHSKTVRDLFSTTFLHYMFRTEVRTPCLDSWRIIRKYFQDSCAIYPAGADDRELVKGLSDDGFCFCRDDIDVRVTLVLPLDAMDWQQTLTTVSGNGNRSDDHFWVVLYAINHAFQDPDLKLEEMFVSYGFGVVSALQDRVGSEDGALSSFVLLKLQTLVTSASDGIDTEAASSSKIRTISDVDKDLTSSDPRNIENQPGSHNHSEGAYTTPSVRSKTRTTDNEIWQTAMPSRRRITSSAGSKESRFRDQREITRASSDEAAELSRTHVNPSDRSKSPRSMKLGPSPMPVTRNENSRRRATHRNDANKQSGITQKEPTTTTERGAAAQQTEKATRQSALRPSHTGSATQGGSRCTISSKDRKDNSKRSRPFDMDEDSINSVKIPRFSDREPTERADGLRYKGGSRSKSSKANASPAEQRREKGNIRQRRHGCQQMASFATKT
ncbi:hypothetical protein SARC_07269 [Sphaeroforma arctica JP610]|uniref:Uncharacterized protein n=1 Tax=Sphaeroforma arctica JP610 TaxID=667725 RepID=A0A0L0FUM8_9EUKA|nr:hypothetical protein SARC_07269 [Sphaeroforma arctica JP610]KNC80369.1 hypothetical protein SARC_07269 [Sphaeroforma arctica JP610]|eukprot:XP_014154271.1 hypothetical protein SARC_07269 [Sphaeroforma arctica JP610]